MWCSLSGGCFIKGLIMTNELLMSLTPDGIGRASRAGIISSAQYDYYAWKWVNETPRLSDIFSDYVGIQEPACPDDRFVSYA